MAALLTGPTAFLLSVLVTVNGAKIGRIAMRRFSVLASSISDLPPSAKKVPQKVYFGVNPLDKEEYRGDDAMNPPKVRIDDYFWLRDESREDAEVIAHVLAENAYTEAATSSLKGLKDDLYAEMLSHLKETDEDVPYKYGPYYYYSKTVKGLPYHINCRKLIDGGDEEVILDENEVAEGFEYSDVSAHSPCPTHRYLAYTVDHDGGETYELRIKDTATGELLPDVITGMSGDFCWGSDSSSILYLKLDEEHRPDRLYLHSVGSDPADDVLLLTETDSRFWMGLDKSASERFLFVGVESKETSEVSYIDLQGVTGAVEHLSAARRLKCVQTRIFGLRYDIEHHGERFYITTNKDQAKNNKLVSCPIQDASADSWVDVIPYNAAVQIDEFLPFQDFFAIFGREKGVQAAWVAPANDALAGLKKIEFAEEGSVWSDANFMFDSSVLRIGFTSFLTPSQTIDFDMGTGARTVLKEKEVPNYDRTNYRSARIEATASDGTKIPISLAYHRSAAPSEGRRPLLLYGYGSYGACIDPSFDYKRIALLDRGIVFAIAHIRGGGEMGRVWYEDEGKYLTKLNTFTDFAACATHLVEIKYTSTERLAILGRSAGGLLIGAVVNMFPGLCKCAVADVPFVDVLSSMSDPTIPLTVTEWEEWGNPNEAKFHDYMASYSPYENVREQPYPAMLVTAGLHDPRVAFWEAVKWVAKLRDFKTNSSPLLLKTDMASGHFSASDRYKLLKETALEYAFIVDQLDAQ